MALHWFTWWKRDKRNFARLSHLQFVLYTRTNCHLCEGAHKILERFQKQFGYSLEVVDIDSQLHLVEQFGLTVPVVTVNGKERFRGQINVVLLRRLLLAEMRKLKRGGKAGQP